MTSGNNTLKWLYKIGIERENLRCTKDGKLALTPHPKEFFSKDKNPYFKVDFSESQVEVITPAFSSTDECYNFLDTITEILLTTCKKHNELIWPYSMPCELPDEDDIPIAKYELDKKQTEYREYLSEKYGKKMQTISGIHFNFSFDDKYLNDLYNHSSSKQSYDCFIEEIYMKTARNCLNYQWLLSILFSASPSINNSGYSMRNSSKGYRNKIDIMPDFTTLDNYFKSIDEIIKKGVIRETRELYAPIRIKLQDNKISHIELRILDLNPLEKCGITKQQMDFIIAFLFFCAESKEPDYVPFDYKEISEYGPTPGQLQDALELTKRIMKLCKEQNQSFLSATEQSLEALKSMKVPAVLLKEIFEQQPQDKVLLGFAEKYSDYAMQNMYRIPGLSDMELSTQSVIRAAITRGIKVTICDKNENIILLENETKKEYVKQATKTSKDSYITVLLMQNKQLSKEILNKNDIKVPKSITLSSNTLTEDMEKDIIGRKVVVKPKSTNCGIGINVFQNGITKEELEKAVDTAFSYDNEILIEEYISGKEYRFLVIDGKCVAVTHRRPASVLGDGVHKINELIAERNKEPLRGENHSKPLSVIVVDNHVKNYLKEQGLSLDFVPKSGCRVFLRKNSNISMGGDSIDFTDTASDFLKTVAEKSAKAFNAMFCGVDIMVDGNIENSENYGIIEVNHNPMICMHDFPSEGKSQNVADKVLDALGF